MDLHSICNVKVSVRVLKNVFYDIDYDDDDEFILYGEGIQRCCSFRVDRLKFSKMKRQDR